MENLYIFVETKQKTMKVTSTFQQPFSPIELTITIENKQELNLIKTLLGANLSIPQFLVENKFISEDKEQQLTSIMNDIHNQI